MGVGDSIVSEECEDRVGPFWGYQVKLLGSGESRICGQPTWIDEVRHCKRALFGIWGGWGCWRWREESEWQWSILKKGELGCKAFHRNPPIWGWIGQQKRYPSNAEADSHFPPVKAFFSKLSLCYHETSRPSEFRFQK